MMQAWLKFQSNINTWGGCLTLFLSKYILNCVHSTEYWHMWSTGSCVEISGQIWNLVYFLFSLKIPLLYCILHCVLVRFVLRQLPRQSPVFLLLTAVFYKILPGICLSSVAPTVSGGVDVSSLTFEPLATSWVNSCGCLLDMCRNMFLVLSPLR